METKKGESAESSETPKAPKSKESRFSRREKIGLSVLILLGTTLSVASMIWAIYSVQDMLKGEDVGSAALGLALTMDAMWAATTIVQFLGKRYPVSVGKKKIDLINVLGWLQLAAVMGILAWHGAQMGNAMAAFGAILPASSKVTWMFTLSFLADPAAPTSEDKERIALKRRTARVTLEEMRAEEEMKQAELAAARKGHEARMERLRQEEAEKREADRLAAETQRLLIENEKRLELEKEKADNELTLLREQMVTQMQIEMLMARQEVDRKRLDAERDAWLFTRPAPLRGQVVGRGPLTSLGHSDLPELAQDPSGQCDPSSPEGPPSGLSESEQKRMELAYGFFTKRAEAHRMGERLTQAAYCAANETHPPRLSEAVKAFPEEWFIEQGLAHWRDEK